MSAAVDRANEIVAALEGAGVRATIDPVAAHLPCILVPPPSRTFDLNCGYTARWELAALAPTPTGADHSTFIQLDGLCDAATGALPVETAQAVSWSLNGVDYPAYLLAWNETIA